MIILAEESGPANALCFLSDNQHSRTKKVVSINGPLERLPFWVKNIFLKSGSENFISRYVSWIRFARGMQFLYALKSRTESHSIDRDGRGDIQWSG